MMRTSPSLTSRNRLRPVRTRPGRSNVTRLSPTCDDRRRSGHTLIELLVVISTLTIVISLTGMTFYLLMRSEKTVSQSFINDRSLSRLAGQFRDDVHQSETGNVVDGQADSPNELALGDSSGIRIRYRITKQGVARLLVRKDTVVARDDFRLPDCTVRFAPPSESDPLLRSLVIQRPGATITKNPHAPRPLRALPIDAYLNRRRPVISELASVKADDKSTSGGSQTEERK